MCAEIDRLEAEIAQLKQTIDSLANMPDVQAQLHVTLAEKQQALAQLRTPATPTASAVHADCDAIIATNVTIHNHGSAAPDMQPALYEYLRALGGECNRLSLADADSSDPTRAAAELAAVYTALETATSVEVPKQVGQRSSEQRRQLTAIEALAAHPRLVILGAPGSGKSTLLNYVGLCLARANLGESGWLEQLGEHWTHGALLPLRVILHELAAWLGARQPLPRQGTADLLWQWLVEDRGLPAPLVDYLRKQLGEGRVLLLFDGLDEVPGDLLKLVRDSIRSLVHTAGTSRMVVSCRILDYQQPDRQIAGWPSETIIALSQELQGQFIGRWFDLLALLDRPLNGDPAELCDRLRTEVTARQELRRLAGNPLLLTMMTLVHAYEGRLPGERVRLYEKCVEHLLHNWRKDQQSADKPLREQLGIDGWSDSDVGRLLDRLGYAAHVRGVSSDGETGADLPRLVLIEEARQFFEGYDRLHDLTRAQTFCNYIARYSNGVLQLHDQQIFRFPHRTFQEFLAARRLVSEGDWPDDLAEFTARGLQAADAGPQWREALLLAISQQVVVNKQISPAALLVEELLERHPTLSASWARDVTLAGEVLAEVGKERLVRLGKGKAALWDRTVTALVTILEHLDAQRHAIIPTSERIRAGKALGLLGDPRFPVTIDNWQHELVRRNQEFGKPDGYFCYIPDGTYRIGGWEKLTKSANLALREFWVGRMPITVAQFGLFATVGYAESAERWWTVEGWKWNVVNSSEQPWALDKPRYNQANQPITVVTWYEATAFCNWLTEQLQQELPDGYIVRLPTEAEWETAASQDGAQRRLYPWGKDEPTSELAIYDALGLDAPAPVAICPAGIAACGAFDMVGNVWEWACTAHGQYPTHAHTQKPDFTSNDKDVPIRGSSYYHSSISVHCGLRIRGVGVIDLNGFRIAVAPRLAQ